MASFSLALLCSLDPLGTLAHLRLRVYISQVAVGEKLKLPSRRHRARPSNLPPVLSSKSLNSLDSDTERESPAAHMAEGEERETGMD